jgi:hypothetical protein
VVSLRLIFGVFVTNSEQLRAYFGFSDEEGRMKVSRFAFPHKEKTTVKRALLAVAAALLFLSTFVVPTIAHADGGFGNPIGNGKP